MPNLTTIFFVEDHKILVDAWKEIFLGQPDFKILGDADNIVEAYQKIDFVKPQVVLMDINLKGESGINLIKDLKNTMPFVKIIVVSMHAEYAFVKKMFAMGINGYVTKHSDGDSIFQAIRQVIIIGST